MRLLFALLLVPLLALAVEACSLCSNPINRATLGEEMDDATVVAVGLLSNPRLDGGAIAGAGKTDFTIEKIVKNEGSVVDAKMITLDRYMPVPNPKQPPRFVVFFRPVANQLRPVDGVAVKSPALIEYIDGARAARKQGRVAALVYYAKHLDDADEHVAQDAFVEFAKSKDEDVFAAAKSLDPVMLRRLLAKKTLDSDHVALYAFLLSCCGQEGDAELLLKIANELTGERRNAMDGILAGYISLRPNDGWKRLGDLLSDPKQSFQTRFAAIRAVRMLQGCKGAAIKSEALAAYKNAIHQGELADLVIEDLRRWKWWELTPEIAAQLGRPTHDAPIVRHCLIRYALSCPLPEAREMVARARKIEPDYVEELEMLKTP